jgi:hypothetical protein
MKLALVLISMFLMVSLGLVTHAFAYDPTVPRYVLQSMIPCFILSVVATTLSFTVYLRMRF